MSVRKTCYALLLCFLLVMPLCIPVGATESTDFTDLHGHWAESQLQWAVDRGYLAGTSDTTLAPNQGLTRGMAAMILYRYSGSPTVQYSNRFLDVTPEDYYSKAVSWADQAGLMSGRGDGIFAPRENVTRVEFLTVLYRLRVKNYGVPEIVGMNNWVTLADYNDQTEVSAYARESVGWAVGDLFLAHSNTEGNSNFIRPKDVATRAEIVTLLSRYDCLVVGNAAQVYVVHPEEITTIIFRYGGSAPYEIINSEAIESFCERVNGFTYDHMIRTKNVGAPGVYYYVWLKDKTGTVVRHMMLSVNGIDGYEKTVLDGTEIFSLSWLQSLKAV